MFVTTEKNNNFLKTHYTRVFWGADYEYDDENPRKCDFQG